MLDFFYDFLTGLFSLEIMAYPVAALTVSAVFSLVYKMIGGDSH